MSSIKEVMEQAQEARNQHSKMVKAFTVLLERCQAQVEADPEGVINNPHLYEALHKILLRLCHGNIPALAVRE